MALGTIIYLTLPVVLQLCDRKVNSQQYIYSKAVGEFRHHGLLCI